MPEQLKAEEVKGGVDASTAKQYDTETPMHQQFQEFYETVDQLKIGLLTTNRENIGPVARSMAIAKRNGPDFLFLSNKDSQKFKDLSHDSQCQITFQNSSTQDWVSVTGTCATTSNSDPRIKEHYSKAIKAWFGDLGDGVHDGSPDDPRMALIEVKARHIAYWKSTVTKLGFVKEVAQSVVTGQVAQNGVSREMGEGDIAKARELA